MTTPLRRFALALAPCLTLAFAGCASSPARTTLRPPAVVVTPVENPAPAALASEDLAASAAAETPAPAAASTASAVAATATVNIAAGDAFERLRSGFMLNDVDERAVDRELNWFANNPDYLERVWGRAELYMHYIVEQLEQRGMPRELGLLPVIESAYEPYAYSKARASGLWQFIPGTGSKYGLKQNWWYDGRRDVVESTRAALDYLQELHDEFNGDWLLAIAAYNCGEGAVERAIERNQRAGKPTDFWHLKLPTETRAYVPKLLAMRRLVAKPGDYGLEFSRIPDVAYFASVNTGGQIDMQVVAEIAGISKDELYELNPAFHRWATDPTGPYKVLVPIEVADGLEQTLLSLSPEQRMRVQQYLVERTDTVASVAQHFSTTPALLRELNGMQANATLTVGDTLRVPSATVVLPDKAARAAELFDRRNENTRLARRGRRPDIHVVRRGDTLASIARRAGTDTRTLARLNDMKVGDPLRAGQRLVLAQAPAKPAAASASSSTRSVAAAASSQSGADGKRVTYTVRRGDTLYSIARILQVTVGELLGWNTLGKSGSIKPGQKLVAFVR